MFIYSSLLPGSCYCQSWEEKERKQEEEDACLKEKEDIGHFDMKKKKKKRKKNPVLICWMFLSLDQLNLKFLSFVVDFPHKSCDPRSS